MSCHSIWYPLDTGNYQHWCFRYLSPVTGAPVSAYSPYQKIKISVNPHGTIHWKPNTGHRTNPLPRHRLAEDKQNQLLFPIQWFEYLISRSYAPFDGLYNTTNCPACQDNFWIFLANVKNLFITIMSTTLKYRNSIPLTGINYTIFIINTSTPTSLKFMSQRFWNRYSLPNQFLSKANSFRHL